jgi:hypothetical protein
MPYEPIPTTHVVPAAALPLVVAALAASVLLFRRR